MRKRLTLLTLALVLCLTGAFFAAGCSKEVYTVTYYAENGIDVLATKQVEEGSATTSEIEGVEEKAGYTVVWNDTNGNAYDFTAAVNANLSLTLAYVAKTDIAYKVEHYVESVTGKFEVADTENLTGTTAETVTATPKTYEGCAFAEGNKSNVKSAAVKGDGSTVLKLYYERNEYEVTFKNGNKNVDKKDAKHGATVETTKKVVPDQNKTTTTVETFSHWSATENGEAFDFNTVITADTTLYAVFKTVSREYEVTVDTTGADGFWTVVPVSESTTVTAGQAYQFTITLGEEAVSVAEVTATIGNDIEDTEETVAVTATDGVYSVTVTGETVISVKVNAAMYDATVAYNVVLGEYENSWALPQVSASDFKLKAFNTETEEATEFVPSSFALTGTMPFSVKAGTYNLYVVRVFGEEEFPVSNQVEFTINKALNNAGSSSESESESESAPAAGNEVDGLLTVRPVAFSKFENAEYDNTNSISAKGNDYYFVDFAGFNPGTADFAATVSYDQPVEIGDYSSPECVTSTNPSIGMDFYGDGHSVGLLAFGEGNARVNVDDKWDWEGGYTHDHARIFTGAGALFGRLVWGDCYRHVTLTYVKTGGWMYVIANANGKAGYIANGAVTADPTMAPTLENFLFYMVDIENGVAYFRNSVLTGQFGKFENPLLTDALTNINTVGFRMQAGTNTVDVNASGYGYTTNADVIASYMTATAEQKQDIIDGANAEDPVVWKNVKGTSLHVQADGSVVHRRMNPDTNDIAIDKTFVPMNETLELQYTLTGMEDRDANWSMAGFFIQDTVTGGMVRINWFAAGDVVLMETKNDYSSRIFMENIDGNQWVWFGSKTGYYTWQNNKEYFNEYELTVKAVISQYRLSLYVKTSESKKTDDNWITICENYDLYGRYNKATTGFQNDTGLEYVNKINDASGRKQWVDDFYTIANPCTFGITSRVDWTNYQNRIDIQPTFSNISYKITNPNAGSETPGGSGGSEEAPGGSGGSEETPGGNGGSEEAPGGSGGSEETPGGNGGSEEAPGGNGGSEEAPGGSNSESAGGSEEAP